MPIGTLLNLEEHGLTNQTSAPEQGFYDDVRQIATIGDFFEDGACFMAKPEHPVFLMSAVLDVAAKRALASPSYGIERSESLTEFNVAPCNMMKQGMEALGLYKARDFEIGRSTSITNVRSDEISNRKSVSCGAMSPSRILPR